MPKRRNPFGDIAPLQFKIHVGQKELSQGVFGQKYKQEIFEKTKALLFSGAQAFMNGLLQRNSESCTLIQITSLGGNQDSSNWCGQTVIGKDGKLLKSISASHKAVLQSCSRACSACVRSVGAIDKCTQCDRLICQSCSKSCSYCSRICCSLCLVTAFDGSYEKMLCNDCLLYS
ncbi:apoptosis regulatory protein Siva [Protopterus annectens]|uniref:apoptosis regulatory protein Siva n=1 Tax=Protopterus annectens TaxID=7888 RepID=UPI001CFADE54|nr:apoptosis regulatory protein Siva [Protopterus annectens]